MFRIRVFAATCALSLTSAVFSQPSAKNLPKPYATPSAKNGATVIPQPDGISLKVPAGFNVSKYASGFARPRFMVEGPSGEVLVSDTVANGTVHILTGTPAEKKPLLSGLDRPYGMAFHKGFLYVAEATSLKRYKYDAKAMTATEPQEVVAMKDFGKGHVTRTIAFDAKGEKMYLAIGSSGDALLGDPEARAAVNRYNPDGTGHEVFASGLRNPVGLRFFPGTNDLWVSVQERDGLGDELVPDYFTKLRQGAFYGWPYSYIGPNEDPRITPQRKDMVDKAVIPDVLLENHIAVLDFLFYTGKQFPAKYRNGAFLANHGSSNRSNRIGYDVTFIPFKNGKPAGKEEDFLVGFMLGADKKEVWGRPVGLLQLRDGSLLLSEDGGKSIWRVSYGK